MREQTDMEEALDIEPKKAVKKKPIIITNALAKAGQESLEAYRRKTYKAPAPYIPGQLYSWVFGFTPLDKPVLWGPYATDAEAEVNAISLDSFEIFHLATVDTARASREVKAELIARGVDPDEAMKRLIHKHVDPATKLKLKKKKRRLW